LIQHADEQRNLVELGLHGGAHGRLVSVADRIEIGGQIAALLIVQTEIIVTVEISHHLTEIGEATIVEVRCSKLSVDQRRRLEAAAATDVMHFMIDKELSGLVA
jgi:hypothetical protein